MNEEIVGEASKKRILMLQSSSDLYGGSKILLITAGLLIKNGHEVIVVLDEEGPLVPELEKAGVEVIIAELGILRRKYFGPLGLVNRLKALYFSRKYLSKIVLDKGIDLIYSNTTGVLVGCYVAKKTKVRHLWHVHEIIKEPALFTQLISWHMKKFADRIIVVSQEVKKHWIKSVDADKIEVIYNGLDYTEYLNVRSTLKQELGLSQDILTIGMVGRVNLWKGQSYFLNIAGQLHKEFPQVHFVMVGDAYPGYEYLYDGLKAIIEKEGLAEVVHDLGYRRDIPNILGGLDIFILPSIQPDPLPTVVLEAMGSARLVAATAHGGALEMVDDPRTGILIPIDDVEASAEKIKKMIMDSDLRSKMGKNARKRALSEFSVDRYEERINALVSML